MMMPRDKIDNRGLYHYDPILHGPITDVKLVDDDASIGSSSHMMTNTKFPHRRASEIPNINTAKITVNMPSQAFTR